MFDVRYHKLMFVILTGVLLHWIIFDECILTIVEKKLLYREYVAGINTDDVFIDVLNMNQSVRMLTTVIITLIWGTTVAVTLRHIPQLPIGAKVVITIVYSAVIIRHNMLRIM